VNHQLAKRQFVDQQSAIRQSAIDDRQSAI